MNLSKKWIRVTIKNFMIEPSENCEESDANASIIKKVLIVRVLHRWLTSYYHEVRMKLQARIHLLVLQYNSYETHVNLRNLKKKNTYNFVPNQQLPKIQLFHPVITFTVWKVSNKDFFLVRIFPYSVQIREKTDQKKFRIWTLFKQWFFTAD